MECQKLFSRKNKKKYLKMSADFFPPECLALTIKLPFKIKADKITFLLPF